MCSSRHVPHTKNRMNLITGTCIQSFHQVQLSAGELKESNELLLRFLPAETVAKALEKEHGKVSASLVWDTVAAHPDCLRSQVRAGSCNLGDPSRVYVRKMQACWRWDWGLELMTIGPDRPITLHLADVQFQEVHTKAIVEENMDRKLKVDIQLQTASPIKLYCQCTLFDNATYESIKQEKIELDRAELGSLDWKLDSTQVQLWWPNGQGGQKRYRFECELINEVRSSFSLPPE